MSGIYEDPTGMGGAPMLPMEGQLGPELEPMAMEEPTEDGQAMRREEPNPAAARRALVDRFQTEIEEAREKWEPAFERMRVDMDFTLGKQWPDEAGEPGERNVTWGTGGGYYVCNITQRHVQNRVATLYARNPRPAVKNKRRLMSTVWDGTPMHAQFAMQKVMMIQQQQMLAQQATMQGMPAEPVAPDPGAELVVQEYQQAIQHRQQVTRFSQTLEILLEYFMGEQAQPFKQQMKRAVRRAVTCGVAWVKVGFARGAATRPDLEARINDLSSRLAHIERLSAELADGQVDMQSAEAEELRLAMDSLQRQQELVVSEGLTFDFPPATAVLPDARCRQLVGFLGCEWVAQEYLMTPEQIMEVYGIDPRTGGYTGYKADGRWEAGKITKLQDDDDQACGKGRVYELYRISDGLVYHLLDGYPDFLREPSAPEYMLERFWPWFSMTFNETEHHEHIYPISDVTLIRDMQLDINRSRQGLREHRLAARPKVGVAAGRLDQQDKESLQSHPQDGIAIIELNSLGDGQKVSDLLQPIELPGVDPNLYDPSPSYQDMLRVVGSSEANLGPATGKGTATENAISESSRMASSASSVDDLDDTLSQLTHGAAQILLSMMSEPQVKLIVGPGALWPQLTRQEIAAEVSVTVEAGSTGRPNKAAKIADFQSVAPFLIQTPGIRPDKLAAYQLRLLDDNIDMADFLDPEMPSIAAANSMTKPSPEDPGNAPEQQGAKGSDKTQKTQQSPGGVPGVPNVPQAKGHGGAAKFMPGAM